MQTWTEVLGGKKMGSRLPLAGETRALGVEGPRPSVKLLLVTRANPAGEHPRSLFGGRRLVQAY
jgi:hypothetical protein